MQAGYDPRAPLSNRQDPAQFAGPLKRDFKGARIAWAGDFGGHIPFEPGLLDLCKSALKTFEALGCTVEEAMPDYPIEQGLAELEGPARLAVRLGAEGALRRSRPSAR